MSLCGTQACLHTMRRTEPPARPAAAGPLALLRATRAAAAAGRSLLSLIAQLGHFAGWCKFCASANVTPIPPPSVNPVLNSIRCDPCRPTAYRCTGDTALHSDEGLWPINLSSFSAVCCFWLDPSTILSLHADAHFENVTTLLQTLHR